MRKNLPLLRPLQGHGRVSDPASGTCSLERAAVTFGHNRGFWSFLETLSTSVRYRCKNFRHLKKRQGSSKTPSLTSVNGGVLFGTMRAETL
jgi:hypothetical protein